MERKKTTYQLDTPFSAVSWPAIEHGEQDVILELLCNLLEPLGHHRRRHLQPSKGRGSRKRKRKGTGQEDASSVTVKQEIPPPPEISGHVHVGLAGISRVLQHLSSTTACRGPNAPNNQVDNTSNKTVVYSAIFVAKPGQSTAFHSHFPQMVAVVSRGPLSKDPIRLVGFSNPCAERLSAALGIPRVSAIGLVAGAPNSKALVEYLKEHVPPVHSPWIDLNLSQSSEYTAANIKAVETVVGGKKR